MAVIFISHFIFTCQNEVTSALQKSELFFTFVLSIIEILKGTVPQLPFLFLWSCCCFFVCLVWSLG